MTSLCKDCGHICDSLTNCLKYQDFNVIVENAQAMAKLKKHISVSAPEFKGNNKWFSEELKDKFVVQKFDISTNYQYRFATITFDPKKFTLNQLTQPILLVRYALNAIYDLRYLFKDKPIIVIEYHKSGIPHIHMNYTVNGPMEHATLILRLAYYFAKDLRNKKCIHDRIFNEGGQQYIKKSNTEYYTFKILENSLDLFLL